MGGAYPGPGLFSKFYDGDHEAMIEVVRDTVGRHDTFNLACTSKYMKIWVIWVILIVLTILIIDWISMTSILEKVGLQ